MKRSRVWLVVVWLVGLVSPSGGATPVREMVAQEVLAADSLRTHTLGLLARGQVTEAIDYWVLTTGKEAPAWLLGLKTAFDARQQVAGACQGVARSIHTAFTQLGRKPELVQLRTRSAEEVPFIAFKMPSGRDMMLTDNGYHVLVRMDGRAYDAYTGAMGMSWAEYMSRLGARSEITQQVVKP
jgi:hypothetical protein